eukprot:1586650-Heterocapsa_arctica.AAC.1
MLRCRGGAPMASQMVVVSMSQLACGHRGCIRGAGSHAAVGAEDDGPPGVALSRMEASAA